MKFRTTVKVKYKGKEEKEKILEYPNVPVKKAFWAETERVCGVKPEDFKIVEKPRAYRGVIHFQVDYDHVKEILLYEEKDPRRVKPLTMDELRKYARSLKVPKVHTFKRPALIKKLCSLLGIDSDKEPPEVVEYLIAGGRIKLCPAQQAPAPKPTKTSQALLKPVKKKRKRTRVRKPRGVSTPRQVPENAVSLSQILEELGVSSRIARRKLRGSDIKKPGPVWVWEKGHKDIAKVKRLLK